MNRDYPARPRRRGDEQGRQERRAARREAREPTFRIFIAVEIPPDAVQKLVGWQREYLASDRSLRLTPPGQLHVTLAFLGNLNERRKQLALAQLDGLEERERFEAAAAGMAGLPPRRPHVIATAIDEPSGRLQRLQAGIAAGLVAKNVYKQEKRPYFPHVTLARVRGHTRFDPASVSPLPVKFTAVRVTLYNSILSREGASHEALKTVQLI